MEKFNVYKWKNQKRETLDTNFLGLGLTSPRTKLEFTTSEPNTPTTITISSVDGRHFNLTIMHQIFIWQETWQSLQVIFVAVTALKFHLSLLCIF